MISLLVVGLTACDILDNQRPQQSLDLEDVLSDPTGVRNLVVGMYNGVQSANISGGNYNILPEIIADNVEWSGSFVTYQQVNQREMDSNNGNMSGWWNSSYSTINSANLILQALDAVDDPTLPDSEKNILRGEALFVRAMLYFEMTRMFAKPWGFTADNSHPGIPVRTTPVRSSLDFADLPRNSVAEVFTQVEADLNQAAQLLPNEGLRANRRATRYVAIGYQMRVAMAKRDFQGAAGFAAQIIDSGFFAITASPIGPFQNEFSSESIFEVIHTQVDNPGVNGGQNAFYATTAMGGRGDIQISQSFVDATAEVITAAQEAAVSAAGFAVVDRRASDLMLTSLVGGSGATRKFSDGVNSADNVMNMRYADILLSRAEALTEIAANLAAVPQEAIDRLNTVRKRAIVVDDGAGGDRDDLIEFTRNDFNNKQELLDAIILERRIELAFEGDRFHTLTRKQLPVRGLDASDNRITFPIPQAEIDSNPSIVQNPGY